MVIIERKNFLINKSNKSLLSPFVISATTKSGSSTIISPVGVEITELRCGKLELAPVFDLRGSKLVVDVLGGKGLAPKLVDEMEHRLTTEENKMSLYNLEEKRNTISK